MLILFCMETVMSPTHYPLEVSECLANIPLIPRVKFKPK